MATLKVFDPGRVKRESAWLREHHSGNVYSQCGEDGIIAEVMSRIPGAPQLVVDVGAGDGTYCSNSRALIERGWGALLLEADANHMPALIALHERNSLVTVMHASVTVSGDTSLDAWIDGWRMRLGGSGGLLSIDIDGCDWHVWRSLENYRPAAVIIEFNPTIPSNVYYVQDADPDVHQGSSLLAMVDLAKSKGYELVATAHFNAVFVATEHFERFEIADNTIDAMHSPEPYVSYWCQFYDGTVLLAGNRRLLWHDLVLDHFDVQVLPSALRKFPFVEWRGDDA